MKNIFLKTKANTLLNSIIFFLSVSIFNDSGLFSNSVYLNLKRKYLRHIFLTKNNKLISLKIKIDRFNLKSKNNLGMLPGMYHAVW